MRTLRATEWSPWAVGVGLGVLSWFAFATADHGLGITTPFEQAAALVERAVVPDVAAPYFTSNKPKIGWEWMVVVGVFLGSLLSARLAGARAEPTVPSLWRTRFGSSVGKRLAAAFAGGALMMFGARVARGCTSGHGITGALLLAVSSWVFIVLAFVVAALTAWTMFRGGEGRDHV